MRNIITMFCVLLLLVGMCACNDSSKNDDSKQTGSSKVSDGYTSDFFKKHLNSLDELPKEVDYLEKDVVRSKAKLIVNGKDISDENYIMYVQKSDGETSYYELPFVSILKELGYSVNWENETTAKISKDGDSQYTLRAHAASLVKEGRNWDLILFIGGGSLRWRFKDYQFVLSQDHAVSVLISEFGAKVTYNEETKTVYIDG